MAAVGMTRAGIDTTLFKAHSIRLASATQMRKSGMSLQQILARAHWLQTSGTFEKLYKRSMWRMYSNL